jgi:hypothetical protein
MLAMARIHNAKPKPEQRADKGIVGLSSLPVPVNLAMALVRLCGCAESRVIIHEADGLQLIAKLFASRHVGPCARRLLLEALVLLTYSITTTSDVAPLLELRDIASAETAAQVSDRALADQRIRAAVLGQVLDVEFLKLVRLQKGLMRYFAAVAEDASRFNHAAALAQVEAKPEETKDADAKASTEDSVVQTRAGESQEVTGGEDDESALLASQMPLASTALEEVHSCMDVMMQAQEEEWPSDTLVSTLVWQAEELSKDTYDACGKLEHLVRDSGHVIVVAASDAKHEQALLAREIARHHMVVWGEGDEKITGLIKDDRPVDGANCLIPLPLWLSLGVGACSAIVVLWTPRFEEDVRCVAQVAYARCLGKTVVVVERCGYGLWQTPPPELVAPPPAVEHVRVPSDASDTAGAGPTADAQKQDQEKKEALRSDALPEVDDHHGRYAVVGLLYAGSFAESARAPDPFLAACKDETSVLWPTFELGTMQQMMQRSRTTAETPDVDGKAQAAGSQERQGAVDKAEEGEKIPKRMAVGFDEIAAASAAGKAAMELSQMEAVKMQEELSHLAKRLVEKLCGFGSSPGPLAIKVSARDVRAILLAQRAFHLSRSESPARQLQSATEQDEQACSSQLASDDTQLTVAATKTQPSGMHPDDDSDQGAALDERELICDLAAAAGLQSEQIVLLGMLGRGADPSLCFALLHITVGTLSLSLCSCVLLTLSLYWDIGAPRTKPGN